MIYETLVTKADWASLEGEILPGGYELKNALELKDAEATFKVRILGSGGGEATATFYQGEPAALNEQVAIWDALRIASPPGEFRSLVSLKYLNLS